ncbi:hypothetical protein NEUTE1DRAFT_59372 [Neurospora tetrasperma FGSC 2508]|uniref:Peptidase M20 dimerisation domain-containing protein n=1 Tax=Neurospora tetrasperma (strain FGSC 2508 / ATCC MYA-4615 / P0657) TaxID=510951 RepID=F8MGV4_NEUT8|nr:uncharacterized protein NEUTE1DRAFT_59372 [Neurospora tetrasperma FGSC 2508]EGO58673.1 hypothetical protein NEUTE1DRAFT_59372 [Neurospora tetrasperma FGSC 2508]EGZ72760.1 carboxypeptidase S [Neurospora tetrasperma FGSC 2509]
MPNLGGVNCLPIVFQTRKATSSSTLNMEKGTSLPVAYTPTPAPASTTRCKSLKTVVKALALGLPLYALYAWHTNQAIIPSLSRANVNFASQCEQPPPLKPSQNEKLDKAYDFLSTEAFLNASVARLSGAVRVKSESFDDLGAVGEDPRWDVFYDFASYLKKTFPLIHSKLQVDKVNTHGLLYTWEGSNKDLKPTLLMAHQDTVPVPPETIPAWTYPPWSGEYDGKYIWGRGAGDCKNQLIAIMETVELLLEAGWEPKRTILLSFGFDEECSGRQGAAHLSKFIEERYGKDSLAVIVDEGAGFEKTWGTLFAKPGTAEKGYTDVYITVRMPGGHSSIPSDHTSIGVLSELITRIEAEQYRTHLEEENPYFTQLQCGAAHSPQFSHKLKKLLAHRKRHSSSSSSSSSSAETCKTKDYLALEAAREGGPAIKYLMQTSQAVDVISGGIKTNALPERVRATINHRINIGETPQVVYDRLTNLAAHVAKRHGLSLHAFDSPPSSSSSFDSSSTDLEVEPPNSLILSKSSHELLVAPITPSSPTSGGPFAVLAGTTRALYGEQVIVTPGIMTGNTDTRYYWDLTRHIFRWGPGYDPSDDDAGLGNIHTVNERVSVRAHVNGVKWFWMFLRNMDEVKGE